MNISPFYFNIQALYVDFRLISITIVSHAANNGYAVVVWLVLHLLHQGVNSRNSRRPPPSSVNTGGVTEIMAEGGELEFVKRIIHDSVQLKRRLRFDAHTHTYSGTHVVRFMYLMRNCSVPRWSFVGWSLVID